MKSVHSKKVLIVDDHQLFADGLSLILSTCDEPIETTVKTCGQKLIEESHNLRQFDLILIDLTMPVFNGFAFLMAMKSKSIPVNVAVISGTEKQPEIEKALRLGATGFVPKDSDSKTLVDAVQRLLRGERFLPDHWVGKVDWLTGDDCIDDQSVNLTARQIQVLELMRDGLQNKQIALALGISVSAVKGHIEAIFKALGVNNRTSCVQVSQELNII